MGGLTKSQGRAKLREREESIRDGVETFLGIGHDLKAIRDHELYRHDGHEDWASYCRDRWQWSKRHCDRLIVLAEYASALPEVGPRGPTWTEKSVRELSRLGSRKSAARVANKVLNAIDTTKSNAQPLKFTAATVRKFVDEDMGIDRAAQAKKTKAANALGRPLHSHLTELADRLEWITTQLQPIPADVWTLLEEEHSGLVTRVAAASAQFTKLLRSKVEVGPRGPTWTKKIGEECREQE